MFFDEIKIRIIFSFLNFWNDSVSLFITFHSCKPYFHQFIIKGFFINYRVRQQYWPPSTQKSSPLPPKNDSKWHFKSDNANLLLCFQCFYASRGGSRGRQRGVQHSDLFCSENNTDLLLCFQGGFAIEAEGGTCSWRSQSADAVPGPKTKVTIRMTICERTSLRTSKSRKILQSPIKRPKLWAACNEDYIEWHKP